VPEAVVELARLRLREHLVRLDDLLEPLVSIRRVRDVGMQLPSELAEGLLDVALPGGAVDAEDLVVVTTRRRHADQA
jgi:hypothetical protein